MSKTSNIDSELKKEALQEALESGHHASEILGIVLNEVSELHCPESSGFEGPETYLTCGKCIVCLAREVTSKNEHEEEN